MGRAAAKAASVRGASSMCQVTISGAEPSAAPVCGSAVNGTPAAVPVIVSMRPLRFCGLPGHCRQLDEPRISLRLGVKLFDMPAGSSVPGRAQFTS
jgi:hypothetical protein